MLTLTHKTMDCRLNNLNITPEIDDDNYLQKALAAVSNDQDKKAFEVLFKYFSPKIRAFGLQRFGQEAQALELVQDTMLLVWRKACLFNVDKGKATTWVYTIMRNRCFDMLRKKKTQKEDQVSEDLWPIIEEEQEKQEQQDHLLSRQLLAQIESLPEQQREIIEQLYVNGLSQPEVASLLNIPLGTVKSRLRLAISKLKMTLETGND